MGAVKCTWQGVFPAATTQFGADYAVDLDATARVFGNLIKDGVSGLIVCGTVGEGNTLSQAEKAAVIETGVAVARSAGGRTPILVGVAEYTAAFASDLARTAKRLGADGLMLLPPMVYSGKERETIEHFRKVAAATDLPVMLYNNPPAYRVSIGFDVLEKLAALPNIVAVKESAPDPRRFTDLINRFGDRFQLMAGLDDVALEAMLLGAKGWVSGLTSAFPKESVALTRAAARRDLDTALAIYRWFMPLLHLDAEHDLVQSIKLAEQIMGRGSERVRLPRLPLSGARRAEVTAMVEKARTTRGQLSSLLAA